MREPVRFSNLNKRRISFHSCENLRWFSLQFSNVMMPAGSHCESQSENQVAFENRPTVIQTSVGQLLKTRNRPPIIIKECFGFKTMVLKKIKDTSLGYHHGSQFFEKESIDWHKKAKSLWIL
jgi:hypothetical protein